MIIASFAYLSLLPPGFKQGLPYRNHIGKLRFFLASIGVLSYNLTIITEVDMFKHLRKNMKLVMWMVLVAFVLWGGGSFVASRSQTSLVVGKVFGKKVLYNHYVVAWEACRNQAMMMYGDKFHQVAEYLNLEKEAWDRIILLKEAKRRKVKVPDKEVIEKIRNMPLFQSSQGTFAPDMYERIITYYLKTQPRNFEEQIRQSLVITSLRDSIMDEVTITDEELLEEYKNLNEKIKVEYIEVDPKNFKSQVSLNQELVQNYYNKNRQDFKVAEQVNVDYVTLEKETQDIEDLVDKVLIFLDEEPDLKKCANEFKLPLKSTGFFSQNEKISDIGWSLQFSQAAFALEEGQISRAISTPTAYYFIELKKKRSSFIPKFEEIKEKVKEIVINQKAKELARNQAAEILSKIKEELKTQQVGFAKIIEKLNLQIKQTEFFTRAGFISELGYIKEFAEASFNLEMGSVSELINGSDKIYILSPKEKQPIDTGKFEEEKQDFAKKALSRKKLEHFIEWFNELKKKANLQVLAE